MQQHSGCLFTDNGLEASISPYEITADGLGWYAVRLFSLKHASAVEYVRSFGLTYFIPMELSFIAKGKNEPKQVLHPVVFNLLFIKKDREESEIKRIIINSSFKMAIIKKENTTSDLYEIPAKQMQEFMLMCSPQFTMAKYISEADAKLKVGTPVIVKYGSLKGLTGKLVRQSKKYFLLKEVPGMGVMLKVSRWCCVPLNDGGEIEKEDE